MTLAFAYLQSSNGEDVGGYLERVASWGVLVGGPFLVWAVGTSALSSLLRMSRREESELRLSSFSWQDRVLMEPSKRFSFASSSPRHEESRSWRLANYLENSVELALKSSFRSWSAASTFVHLVVRGCTWRFT